MKINIIIDNKKSWFYGKVERLAKEITKRGHTCDIFSEQKEIPNTSDITFFLSCAEYVTQETREKSKFNIVIHASDLPEGKGMSPTTWKILEGKSTIPVTLFEVADKIDAGDYYLKDAFDLDGTELIEEWQEKLYICIERMALIFIEKLNDLKPIAQQGESSVYRRRTPEDSELDIHKSLESQFNLLRVCDNEQYPAFFMHNGKKYIIKIFKEK